MFIKLTRLDNTPIWINAAFVVTVEPRKGGGSVVVPIGDGLDYDVRETTDQVLAMLGDAPAPAVVPVPAPKLLAPTPEDVSPDTEPPRDAPPADRPAEEAKPTKRVRRTRKVAEGDAAEPKPAKRTRRAKKAAEDAAETPEVAAPVPPEAPAPVAERVPDEVSDALVERLRKMMPGSMRKLRNTLVTQFKVADVEAVVASLQTRGVIEVEHEHVIWR